VPATVAVRESLEEIKDEQSAFEFTALTLWGYGTQTKEALLFFCWFLTSCPVSVSFSCLPCYILRNRHDFFNVAWA